MLLGSSFVSVVEDAVSLPELQADAIITEDITEIVKILFENNRPISFGFRVKLVDRN